MALQVHETGEAAQVDALTDRGKSVYVDPLGTPGVDCDFNTIEQAAQYLKGLPGLRGGTVALRGGVNHDISTVVDARGLIFTAVGQGRPVIRRVGVGRFRASGCQFKGIAFENSVMGFLLDLDETGHSDFLGCDFRPAVSNAYIFGSTGIGVVPTLTIRQSGQSNQTGRMMDPSAVFPSINIILTGTNGLGALQFGARNVTVDLDARYDTTGLITGVPDGSLSVAPGESIQSRLDSLPNGGQLSVLPGIHDITEQLHVCYNDVEVVGLGNAVIRALSATWHSGAMVTVFNFGGCVGDTVTITTSVGAQALTEGVHWTAAGSNNATALSLATAINATSGVHGMRAVVPPGCSTVRMSTILAATTITSVTTTDATNLPTSTSEATIVIGATTGKETLVGCVLSSLYVHVEKPLHGIWVVGGSENKVDKCNVTALYAGASPATNRVGILFTNGNGTAGRKFTCSNCLVSRNASPNAFTDGIHFDGGVVGGFTGIFGFPTNDGIYDSQAFNNVVEYCGETVLLLTRCFASSLFLNRTRFCPLTNGIVFGSLVCTDCEFVDCSIEDNPDGGGVIVVYGYESRSCIYRALTINAGTGTDYGTGIYFTNNCQDNLVEYNVFRNVVTAISISNTGTNVRNIIGPNSYEPSTVTTRIADAETTSPQNYYIGKMIRGTGNPNGVVSGNFGDTFFDTATSTLYKCTSYPVGTVWQVI